jgi:predicted choloylglycine hydrolase
MSLRSFLLSSLVLILCWDSAGTSARAAEPFRFPEARHGKGELKYINGVPVLIVEGTPEEIGEQVAVLVSKPCKRLLHFPRELLTWAVGADTVKLVWPVCIKEGAKLLDNFPPDHKKEMEAIIKTSGVDRQLIEVANTLFDLKSFLKALLGCSALVVEGERSATGQPIFGRNMDYMGLGYLQDYSLISVYRPRGKYAFAAIGYPGLVGVISGINEKGLAITALETTGTNPDEGPAFNPAGTPFALCYRRLLEECSTVDEAAKLLSSMKRSTTNNLTVCDRTTSAVFEFSPTQVRVRKAEKCMSTCTNHFLSPELRLLKPKNNDKTLDRYTILEKARAETKKLGVADVQRYLDSVHQGELTLQTMIFEPATLTVHFAHSVGKSPASSQKLTKLDLGPLLKRERAAR